MQVHPPAKAMIRPVTQADPSAPRKTAAGFRSLPLPRKRVLNYERIQYIINMVYWSYPGEIYPVTGSGGRDPRKGRNGREQDEKDPGHCIDPCLCAAADALHGVGGGAEGDNRPDKAVGRTVGGEWDPGPDRRIQEEDRGFESLYLSGVPSRQCGPGKLLPLLGWRLDGDDRQYAL